ncbi:hypothetical protein PF005_g13521 [Phytophthora fragariae]|uniref:Secreted protein n=1 Tax=Phytophthora fragariae TaxID=53985 RepID=A0A6A4BZC5_9STRA|nr:hypothetical protein PF003_g25170 [Phytophthora fragariae]KAE8924182.1 hypothetical protein PF009_g25584 [Phytophthora fragariae]KAE8977978.1 hypothetical protein PF011_g23434 [Phytophthora fragariae]KAE9090866.1 hypothetical protein PF006_g25055 [Phytophthora fragariae]KAE9110445.1 hypothetical protein PF010_g11174 [Phytophthora fragariae]
MLICFCGLAVRGVAARSRSLPLLPLCEQQARTSSPPDTAVLSRLCPALTYYLSTCIIAHCCALLGSICSLTVLLPNGTYS